MHCGNVVKTWKVQDRNDINIVSEFYQGKRRRELKQLSWLCGRSRVAIRGRDGRTLPVKTIAKQRDAWTREYHLHTGCSIINSKILNWQTRIDECLNEPMMEGLDRSTGLLRVWRNRNQHCNTHSASIESGTSVCSSSSKRKQKKKQSLKCWKMFPKICHLLVTSGGKSGP